MDKIEQLLVKAGCNPELVAGITSSMESFKQNVRESYQKEFDSKLSAAKKICVEETEAYKRELAKRVQIFCETKSAVIESQLSRQSALSESKAQTKLKQVYALLEGIELNGSASGATTAAIENAKRQVRQLSEERNKAVEKANRQTAIAEKALKANRTLVTENAKLKKVLTESSPAPVSRANNAQRKAAAKPMTSRQTLAESQVRQAPKAMPKGNGRQFGIVDVARSMAEDL
jgi:hypothetical protein